MLIAAIINAFDLGRFLLPAILLHVSLASLLAFGICPCCGVCIYHMQFSDLFDRADSTSLGSDWTEVAGDWSIASNKLQISTANARLKCEQLTAYSLQISATVRSTASGDKIRILTSYDTGEDEYTAVELTVGTSAKIAWWERVLPAAETKIYECSVTAAANADHLLEVRVFKFDVDGADSGDVHVVLLNGVEISSVKLRCSLNTTGTATVVGLATGDTVTGTVTFDAFAVNAWDWHIPPQSAGNSCPQLSAVCWPPHLSTPNVSLVMSGYAGSTFCTSGECGTLNGTFVLDYNENQTTTDLFDWSYDLTGLDCNATHTISQIRLLESGSPSGGDGVNGCRLDLRYVYDGPSDYLAGHAVSDSWSGGGPAICGLAQTLTLAVTSPGGSDKCDDTSAVINITPV